MQLAPNVVVAGRFRLERPLGKGGMGSVWRATHLGLDIPCAVKFMEGTFAQNPEMIARFEREAKAAAQLRSPNVVQILDHGIESGTPYIAMELLDGEDLRTRLERRGRLPPDEVVRVVMDVSRALTKAHAAGVVHRDMKPDNIYLVRDDDREIAKVLDFGVAKAGSSLQGGSTRTGALLGTPYYMSPEQAQGTRAVDARSDLWSLAVIVYQCIVGRLPFESDSLGDLLIKIITGPIPVPSEIAPDVPRRFDQWWARASQRDPDRRFQTARDLELSLSLAFGLSPAAGRHVGSTVEMPLHADPSEPRAAPRPVGPAPGGAVTAAAQPLAAFASASPVAAAPRSLSPAPYASTAPPVPAPPRSRSGILVAGAALALLVVAGGVVGVAVIVRGRGASAISSSTAPSAPASVVAPTSTEPDVAPSAAAAPSAADSRRDRTSGSPDDLDAGRGLRGSADASPADAGSARTPAPPASSGRGRPPVPRPRPSDLGF